METTGERNRQPVGDEDPVMAVPQYIREVTSPGVRKLVSGLARQRAFAAETRRMATRPRNPIFRNRFLR